jgi:predicted kinase
VPFHWREAICTMIRSHQVPFFLIERDDPTRSALALSQGTRCDHLALLTEADARGRICADLDKLLTNIALFAEFCREQQCLTGPRAFGSDHSRVAYFRTDGRDPDYLAHDDTTCEVVMMCGLPGMGKDTWIARNVPEWPVISLDDLRKEMDVEHGGPQGEVIQAAQERARVHLRAKRNFVLNATSLTREIRGLWLNLFYAYHARVRIAYVETRFERQREQNRGREARVPEAVIRRMMTKWEVPDLTEVHQIDWVLS